MALEVKTVGVSGMPAPGDAPGPFERAIERECAADGGGWQPWFAEKLQGGYLVMLKRVRP